MLDMPSLISTRRKGSSTMQPTGVDIFFNLLFPLAEQEELKAVNS